MMVRRIKKQSSGNSTQNNYTRNRGYRYRQNYDRYQHDEDSDYPPEHWEERYYNDSGRYGGRYERY